ncbi:DUF5677 domain-containing protein [Microbacterium sp. T2.11-28]|uniref:DUF6988 family protein n=1 Tax=Microbacterium sp. T2.11-28 TaxID=3041169 RepID=UPI0024772EAF|nr:DUF5677 domain-containing protein [Microbacterium sp. T2.11-28]CAI9385814.1 hypothetical protein MICABA_00017 [Microbacterium sp. T2.11-28]
MTVDADELRDLTDQLLDLWQAHGVAQPLHQPAARRGKRFEGHDVARLTAIVGLTRHVHETASAIALLIDAGQINTAIPLVRMAYENALTAAWLAQSEEDHGIRAFLLEHSRQRAALKTNSLKAASATFREGASQIADADSTGLTGSLDSARQFHDICLDLAPGGEDAYIYYRILSAHSHASVGIADLYFARAPSDDTMPAWREEPDIAFGGAGPLLFFTACAMVWSARTFSYVTRDQGHRDELRRIARELKIQSDLKLSDHYRRRHAQRRRQERAQGIN